MKKLAVLGLKKYLLIGLVLFILVLIGVSFYLFSQNLVKNPFDPPTPEEEVKILTSKIGKLIELPTGETPTVATVSDKTKLLDQPFFKNAQNGDKVLIYSKTAKAILYRPSINKIIEVAPVNLGSTPVSPVSSPSAETEKEKIYKVAIYNGTKTSGLARTTSERLKGQFKNIEVVVTNNTAENYDTSVVVDLKGLDSSLANDLAKAVSGKVGSLPSGEVRPEGADILIILGSSSE